MISNACATMRTAKSFLPLLRPFIIKLTRQPVHSRPSAQQKVGCVPVNQALNDGHLRLLELLLGITASGVGEVDGVTDLDVVGEGDVDDVDAVRTSIVSACRPGKTTEMDALLGVPLAEELDILAELGDVLGESLNRGHFGGRES